MFGIVVVLLRVSMREFKRHSAGNAKEIFNFSFRCVRPVPAAKNFEL